MANSNLGNEILRPETFGKTRQELPLRIAGPLLRPVLGEASYGNVALSCGVGYHVDLRGLPGGAEGIRTSDLCGALSTPAALPVLEGLIAKARCRTALASTNAMFPTSPAIGPS